MMTFTFMMCSERSGSNLLTRLMDAHPDVCGPTPVHLLRSLADHRHRYGDLSEDTHWQAFVQAAVDLFETKLGSWSTRWTVDSLRAACPQRSLVALFRTVYEAEARARGKTRLFVKTNHLHRYLSIVLKAFPDARIVHQVRDPRDQALSWKRARELRGDVVRASRVWTEDQTQAMKVQLQLEGTGVLHWHRYEDLVDQPERVLRSICAHIGLDYTPAMLGFHEKAEARDHAASTASWANVSRPLMKGNHGKFRGVLSDDEVRLIEWRGRSPMAFFGYTPDGPIVEDIEGEAILARLTPLERHEKAGYQEVSQTERDIRAARGRVLQAIAARPTLPAP